MAFWFGSFSGTATPDLRRIERVHAFEEDIVIQSTKDRSGSFLRMGVGSQQSTCYPKLGGTS